MITPEDFDIITKQLGRKPIGALEVMVKDRDNNPAVLLVDPLPKGKPFPSMYWLTSPLIHKAIAEIESTAWIKDFENNILPNDSALALRLRQDNEKYRDLRWQLFNKLHPQSSVEESYLKVLRETGVGGIQNFSRVRCLHMHYAYHLVHGGVVGEELDKQFDLRSLIFSAIA